MIPEHGIHCIRLKPTPSFTYLCKHSGLDAYSVNHSVSNIISHVDISYSFNISQPMASRLKEYSIATQNTEVSLSYKGILPWLVEFVKLNPGSQYHYEEDLITHRFISCGLLLPCEALLMHSFLDTLFIDAGHCRTPSGVKLNQFILTMGDREHRNRPIAYGWFKSESYENYKSFLKMVTKSPSMEALINRYGVSCMHDRHLSFQAVVAEILSKCKDRLDIVHIVRNTRTYFPKANLSPLIAAAFSRTKSDHDGHWNLLDDKVKEYLQHIPKVMYCTYAASEVGLQVNGERTSNRVEQEMIRTLKLGIRHEDPLVALVRVAEEYNRLIQSHQSVVKSLLEHQEVLIPFASKHYEAMKNRATDGYRVKSMSGLELIHVRYNDQECYRRDVNLIAEPRPTCTCMLLEQDGMVCAHIIVACRTYLKELKWDDETRLKNFSTKSILFQSMRKRV